MHSGDRCIIDMFYVYLKAMDEEGPFYRRPLPPEGSQKIHFAQQTLEINKFKYFMKIIAERGELGKIYHTQWDANRGHASETCFEGLSE